MSRTRSVLATFFGIGLVAIAAALAGMVIASGALWSSDRGDGTGPAAPIPVVQAAPVQVIGDPVAVAGVFQSEPRDPFRPLLPDGDTSTTSTTLGPGQTTSTTVPGSTTSTTDDFTPETFRVTLVEIRETAGVLRATVIVNGTTYNVGVGETFASGRFKVISLTRTKGVFTFGDRVFELSVGQEILK